jgi:hypothetical protein
MLPEGGPYLMQTGFSSAASAASSDMCSHGERTHLVPSLPSLSATGTSPSLFLVLQPTHLPRVSAGRGGPRDDHPLWRVQLCCGRAALHAA